MELGKFSIAAVAFVCTDAAIREAASFRKAGHIFAACRTTYHGRKKVGFCLACDDFGVGDLSDMQKLFCGYIRLTVSGDAKFGAGIGFA